MNNETIAPALYGKVWLSIKNPSGSNHHFGIRAALASIEVKLKVIFLEKGSKSVIK